MSGHRGGYRSTVLGALLCVFVITSGCVGVLTGSEPAVFRASSVGVTDAALSSTDFEQQAVQSSWTNRTFEVGGQEREVRILNHFAVYENPLAVTVDGKAEFGFFISLSTPQASIAGQALNPVGRMSSEQLVDQGKQLIAQSAGSGDIQDIQRVDARTKTILGTESEIVRFSGTAHRSGQEVPVYIEVTRVQDGEDYVVAVGVYPQDSEDVPPQVETMFGSIQH